ncbi:hypothetical protein BS17DRAFT_697322 [Gyrodon lividus]|nr:hypothetical protein BS17DRAFT_697322 [Gyrodon lividus]
MQQRGVRAIRHNFEEMNLQAAGKLVQLSYSTLLCLAAGGMSLAEIHVAVSWLTPGEAEQGIAYAEELGNRGFPFSYRHLCEHINEICHTRLGAAFPGVGKQ